MATSSAPRSRDDRSAPGEVLDVEIRRSDPHAPSRFEVPRRDPMVVLDVLLAVQHRHDATLAFRYSCRTAACGTCTVQLDGRPVLACHTSVPQGPGPIVIEPLRALPVVRDLVVDMAPFFGAWREIVPYPVMGVPSSAVPVRAPAPRRRDLVAGDRACISCGACYAACDMTGSRNGFLGPAALTRAMVLAVDERDEDTSGRLRRVTGVNGVGGCHYIGACTAVCPKGLDPARAVRRLRRWALRP